jgi:hypothetical protein
MRVQLRPSPWPILLSAALLILISVPALARERVKAKSTEVKRERVTVSFAADEGFEQAERARAEFLRKSRERREAMKRAEAAKQPKTVNVKVGTARSAASFEDELGGKKDKRREVGMAWISDYDTDLKESSIDGEVDELNTKDFKMTPEDKKELAELMRMPTSVPPTWIAVSPLSAAKYSAY